MSDLATEDRTPDRREPRALGWKIAKGTPDEIKVHPEIIAAYLGVEEAAACLAQSNLSRASPNGVGNGLDPWSGRDRILQDRQRKRHGQFPEGGSPAMLGGRLPAHAADSSSACRSSVSAKLSTILAAGIGVLVQIAIINLMWRRRRRCSRSSSRRWRSSC